MLMSERQCLANYLSYKGYFVGQVSTGKRVILYSRMLAKKPSIGCEMRNRRHASRQERLSFIEIIHLGTITPGIF